MVDLNGTQAAIRCGYAIKSANVEGARLLTNANIETYISELQLKAQEKTGITAERVIAEYAKIAFFDIRKIYGDDGNLLPVCDLDDDSAAAIAGIESYEERMQAGEETIVTGVVRKVKISDKIRALDGLGKHLGIFDKDNSQKKPIVNVNDLSADALLQVLEAQKAVHG